MLKILIDNTFFMFGGPFKRLSVFHLCSSSRRLVPLFVRGRFHTGVSQEIGNEVRPIF
jgi:hypothetical protein